MLAHSNNWAINKRVAKERKTPSYSPLAEKKTARAGIARAVIHRRVATAEGGYSASSALAAAAAAANPSRNPLSCLLRTGCCSLRTAFASICRTRSRVTLKIRPTSSRV